MTTALAEFMAGNGVDTTLTSASVPPHRLNKRHPTCRCRVLGPPAWAPDFGTAVLPMAYRRRQLRN